MRVIVRNDLSQHLQLCWPKHIYVWNIRKGLGIPCVLLYPGFLYSQEVTLQPTPFATSIADVPSGGSFLFIFLQGHFRMTMSGPEWTLFPLEQTAVKPTYCHEIWGTPNLTSQRFSKSRISISLTTQFPQKLSGLPICSLPLHTTGQLPLPSNLLN